MSLYPTLSVRRISRRISRRVLMSPSLLVVRLLKTQSGDVDWS